MNIDKLKSCILYACTKAITPLDGMKLNKVLWYADTASYMERGESVTGVYYIRKPQGPAADHMTGVLIQLETAGKIKSRFRFSSEHNDWLNEFMALDKSLPEQHLSPNEMTYLDNALNRVCDQTSDDIKANKDKERKQKEIWELASEGEELPLSIMFAEKLAPITDKDIQHAIS